MHWYFVSWHWLETHIGVLPLTPNRAYNFWSGFGSDIGEVAIFGAVIAGYRKVNCHEKGCWRIAHHEYEMNGVTYKYCRKHHPLVDHKNRLTAADALVHANGLPRPAEVVKPRRAANGRFT